MDQNLKEHNARVREWAGKMPTPTLRKVALAFAYPANRDTCSHEYPLHWLADNSRRYHSGKDAVGRRTLVEWLPVFEASGAIQTERRRDKGQVRASVYHIDFTKVVTEEDMGGRARRRRRAQVANRETNVPEPDSTSQLDAEPEGTNVPDIVDAERSANARQLMGGLTQNTASEEPDTAADVPNSAPRGNQEDDREAFLAQLEDYPDEPLPPALPEYLTREQFWGPDSYMIKSNPLPPDNVRARRLAELRDNAYARMVFCGDAIKVTGAKQIDLTGWKLTMPLTGDSQIDEMMTRLVTTIASEAHMKSPKQREINAAFPEPAGHDGWSCPRSPECGYCREKEDYVAQRIEELAGPWPRWLVAERR